MHAFALAHAQVIGNGCYQWEHSWPTVIYFPGTFRRGRSLEGRPTQVWSWVDKETEAVGGESSPRPSQAGGASFHGNFWSHHGPTLATFLSFWSSNIALVTLASDGLSCNSWNWESRLGACGGHLVLGQSLPQFQTGCHSHLEFDPTELSLPC